MFGFRDVLREIGRNPPMATDTVEAIVAEMRGRYCRGSVEHELATRLQSAHDAEVGALREKLDGLHTLYLAEWEQRENEKERADAAESRLREAERDARRYRWLREHEMSVSRHSMVLSDQSEKLDAAIDRAMEGS